MAWHPTFSWSYKLGYEKVYIFCDLINLHPIYIRKENITSPKSKKNNKLLRFKIKLDDQWTCWFLALTTIHDEIDSTIWEGMKGSSTFKCHAYLDYIKNFGYKNILKYDCRYQKIIIHF